KHFNLKQVMRSAYVGFFQLPRLAEWSLCRKNFSLLKRGLRVSSLPGAFTDEDLERHVQAWSQAGALSAMLGWYRAVGKSWRQVEASRDQFSCIRTPALILWGERDPALGLELAEASVPY